jgi:outer membrane protein TolC
MKSVVARGVVFLAAWLSVTPHKANALDLEAALREVATANPTLASRRDMVAATQQRIAPAGAWQSPTFEVGALNVPTSGRFDQDPMTMKMVGIEQRVPLFGAHRLSRQSATAAARADSAALEMANYELFAVAWEAYSDAYFAGRLAESSRAHRGEMEQLVRAARARYESGNGRLDDVLHAEAEQARLLSDLATFDAEVEGARARLAALMGRESAALSDSLEALPVTPPPADADSLIARVNEDHPRLRELRARRDRYLLGARAARRTVWPDLQLGASYGFREAILGVPQDNLWSATVRFMVPVFAGQNELAEGSEQEAMALAAESDLRAATLELDQQARGLNASARSDRRTVALLADTVVVTQRQALAASESEYSAGTSDLWRVFEAMHALYDEEIALTRARQDLARTEARLLAITARPDLFGLTLPAIERSER